MTRTGESLRNNLYSYLDTPIAHRFNLIAKRHAICIFSDQRVAHVFIRTFGSGGLRLTESSPPRR
jgi:hypothetical protein